MPQEVDGQADPGADRDRRIERIVALFAVVVVIRD
jgi:hypothetical protein